MLLQAYPECWTLLESKIGAMQRLVLREHFANPSFVPNPVSWLSWVLLKAVSFR